MSGSQTDNYGNYNPNIGPQPPTVTPTSNAGGVIVGTGNPNTNGVKALPGSMYLDPSGPTLYSTNDGTTWTAIAGSGGGGAQLVTYTSGTPANPPNVNAAAWAYDPNGILPTLGWRTSDQTWN